MLVKMLSRIRENTVRARTWKPTRSITILAREVIDKLGWEAGRSLRSYGQDKTL